METVASAILSKFNIVNRRISCWTTNQTEIKGWAEKANIRDTGTSYMVEICSSLESLLISSRPARNAKDEERTLLGLWQKMSHEFEQAPIKLIRGANMRRHRRPQLPPRSTASHFTVHPIQMQRLSMRDSLDRPLELPSPTNVHGSVFSGALQYYTQGGAPTADKEGPVAAAHVAEFEAGTAQIEARLAAANNADATNASAPTLSDDPTPRPNGSAAAARALGGFFHIVYTCCPHVLPPLHPATTLLPSPLILPVLPALCNAHDAQWPPGPDTCRRNARLSQHITTAVAIERLKIVDQHRRTCKFKSAVAFPPIGGCRWYEQAREWDADVAAANGANGILAQWDGTAESVALSDATGFALCLRGRRPPPAQLTRRPHCRTTSTPRPNGPAAVYCPRWELDATAASTTSSPSSPDTARHLGAGDSAKRGGAGQPQSAERTMRSPRAPRPRYTRRAQGGGVGAPAAALNPNACSSASPNATAAGVATAGGASAAAVAAVGVGANGEGAGGGDGGRARSNTSHSKGAAVGANRGAVVRMGAAEAEGQAEAAAALTAEEREVTPVRWTLVMDHGTGTRTGTGMHYGKGTFAGRTKDVIHPSTRLLPTRSSTDVSTLTTLLPPCLVPPFLLFLTRSHRNPLYSLRLRAVHLRFSFFFIIYTSLHISRPEFVVPSHVLRIYSLELIVPIECAANFGMMGHWHDHLPRRVSYDDVEGSLYCPPEGKKTPERTVLQYGESNPGLGPAPKLQLLCRYLLDPPVPVDL
ncbi:hypothetical protein C8R45DRAFT_1083436 [Mycena sanguinolenta]|nr:hypothetical protein C8R45DRAFT_1083436 [Mycena sanguinolenta]